MMRWQAVRGKDGDDGIALITVMFSVLVCTGLMAALFLIASGTLRSSAGHVRFEGAMAAAEAGLDAELAALQANNGYHTGQTHAPFASPEEERAWAVSVLSGGSIAVKDSGAGEYASFKPQGLNVVYSMGWSPSKDAPNAVARLVKAEYLFAPYKSGNAILTGGRLDMSSSITVDVTNGIAGGKANVHANGDITGTGCSQNVNGTITSSGGYTLCGSAGDSGSGGGQAQQPVPQLSARYLYDQFASTMVGNWYDLCPDGKVRGPGATPCTGPVLADLAGSGTFRGWKFLGTNASSNGGPLWQMLQSSMGDGTYYLYQGDAYLHRNVTVNSLTILAEAAPTGGQADNCGKLGGNLSVHGLDVKNASIPGVVFLAETDLWMGSNIQAGSGLFGAGDQVDIQTSSTGITGTVISNDRCTAGGDFSVVKNATVNYDQVVEIPVASIIRTTQWLEMASGA